ncbi:hypothetical protein BCR34DRAFT_598785 [Clohesyomyces aquaticus]|uniref:Uncharacterized protein n=1 Tax=Clohesyomyces aquaticus TaxID=1231657 RepID=A0A1Y1ZX98_9PLEO|nr:hypothetical protein BCR34DRAFT_598785 [Clohesyomyces aquaticus]
MKFPSAAILVLLGAMPSVNFITEAAPVSLNSSGVFLPCETCPPTDPDLGRIIARAPPLRGPTEEPSGGGRPGGEDPNLTPADIGGGEPSGGGEGPFGASKGLRSERLQQAPPAVHAEPLGVTDISENLKLDFAELTVHMSNNPKTKDGALFYSGDTLYDAIEFQEIKGPDTFILLNEASEGYTFREPGKGMAPKVVETESASFAAAASGTARLALPEDGLTSATILSRVEWPQMVAQEGKVDKIIWVDIQGDEVGIIWTEEEEPTEFPLNKKPDDMVSIRIR